MRNVSSKKIVIDLQQKPSEFYQSYGEFDCKNKTGIDTFFWKNGIPSVNPKNKDE